MYVGWLSVALLGAALSHVGTLHRRIGVAPGLLVGGRTPRELDS